MYTHPACHLVCFYVHWNIKWLWLQWPFHYSRTHRFNYGILKIEQIRKSLFLSFIRGKFEVFRLKISNFYIINNILAGIETHMTVSLAPLVGSTSIIFLPVVSFPLTRLHSKTCACGIIECLGKRRCSGLCTENSFVSVTSVRH